MNQKIGFMQGRLSPLIGGKIQSFPWDYWECEFAIAESIDIKIMEWTLDQERLYENPLLNRNGQVKIANHCKATNLSIPSITGDCFMQSPFWKARGGLRQDLNNSYSFGR
jgi:L-ribulose-5-phosphate 3-epimerase